MNIDRVAFFLASALLFGSSAALATPIEPTWEHTNSGLHEIWYENGRVNVWQWSNHGEGFGHSTTTWSYDIEPNQEVTFAWYVRGGIGVDIRVGGMFDLPPQAEWLGSNIDDSGLFTWRPLPGHYEALASVSAREWTAAVFSLDVINVPEPSMWQSGLLAAIMFLGLVYFNSWLKQNHLRQSLKVAKKFSPRAGAGVPHINLDKDIEHASAQTEIRGRDHHDVSRG